MHLTDLTTGQLRRSEPAHACTWMLAGFRKAWHAIRQGLDQHRHCEELRRMDDRLLRDIGLNPMDILRIRLGYPADRE
jgi:uncharacterized protein YjiS (DUF1127 family)